MATKTMEVKESPLRGRRGSGRTRSLSAYGKARSTVQGTPLSADALRKTRRLLASLQLSALWA